MKILLPAALALGLSFAAASAARAQSSGGTKALLASTDQSLYIVDFQSQSVGRLDIKVDSDTNIVMSPDQGWVVLISNKGLSLYSVVGVTIQFVKKISGTPVMSAVWSADSASLVYMRETKTSESAMTTEIFLWDRTKDQTKKIL